MKHLVFGLTANFAAMGELAGHERRGTLEYPGRSALIGLMGAAMGIDRSGDFSELDKLDIAVAIFKSGDLLRDFHTVQSIPSAASKNPNSRPEALRDARDKLATTITIRDYRIGVMYGVAVSGGEADLDRIADALNHPHYTLYLGRKSCVLSAPPAAKVVDAETPEAAIGQMQRPVWLKSATCTRLIRAAAPGDDEVHTVHDVPRDRKLRHFSSRKVATQQVSIVL